MQPTLDVFVVGDAADLPSELTNPKSPISLKFIPTGLSAIVELPGSPWGEQLMDGESDRAALAALQRGRDWIWIAGNHDPEPVLGLGGISAAILAIGGLMFRHQPDRAATDGEIAGHLHPVARVSGRGRTVSRRCFACDGRRTVMPAFGAYAGGLNVRDRAFAAVFGTLAFTAHMLGEGRVYAVAATRCLPD
jgi:hypothetical protein